MTRFSLLALFSLSLGVSGFAYAKQKFQQPAPVHLDRKGEKWARESLKKMSLEQKIGQMFIIWARARFMNVNDPEYIGLRDTMRKYHIGGFGLTVNFDDGFLYKNEPLEAAMLVNRLQADSEFPLIFGADFERGLGFRLNDVTSFPHAMAFGATGNVDYARDAARITAQEARAIGVQWNWFPDADVNSNPLNPIINTRSFGEDPEQVSEMVVAYIEAAHQYGMLTTVKHFPGHGDTDTDSHLAVPFAKADKAHFDTIELPPFRAAIKAGVDAVMVAHIAVPALDPDPNHVASISPVIVMGLLKQQMGFNGLVVTDALDMAGLTKLFPEGGSAGAGRAAVEAVKAGNDMLLIPSNLDGSYQGLLQAVRSGEIPESRIDESVLRILRAKASVGLNRATQVDINAVNRIVAQPASLATAEDIADDAVTLVRDNHQVLPLKATRKGTNAGQHAYPSTAENRDRTVLLIFTDDSRSDAGRVLEHQVRARIPNAKTIYIDSRDAAVLTQPVMDAVNQAQAVIAAIYLSPQGGASTNRIALQNVSAALLENVLRNVADKTVVIALGNPYIAAQLPEVKTYVCTFSDAQVSELSAAKAIFGEIPMSGRLPVTIPNIAIRGVGLGGPSPVSGGGPQ
ncbi:MAG: glycoside hydrolase family 3 N-terminal domain-containing protein [Candidatus Korobacteraceae bacterium]